ncbi:MAG: hypothetical protein MIO90_07070 [Methanomassiliicoccales archaeon]|nr:hypothetical protein [Methanomassiliicoccales archaeon]
MSRSDLANTLLSAACIVLVISLVFVSASNIVLVDQKGDEQRDKELYSTLVLAQSKLSSVLSSISNSVMLASHDLSGTDLNSTEARTIMMELAMSNQYIVNVATGNNEGHIIAAEPSSYSHIEGAYTGDHAATMEMNEFKKPVFSDVFHAVEGFEGALIAYPVIDQDGRMIGSVSALFRVEHMLIDLFDELTIVKPIGLMVEQLDGRILYDTDLSQIGKNTFEDPIYQGSPSLLALAERVSTEPAGEGSYSFIVLGHNFEKKAAWISITLHERSWRVMVYTEL